VGPKETPTPRWLSPERRRSRWQTRVRWLGYDSGIKPGEQVCTVAGCTAEHGTAHVDEPVGNVGYYAPLKENTNRFVKRDI
jgi:hypothetical protein